MGERERSQDARGSERGHAQEQIAALRARWYEHDPRRGTHYRDLAQDAIALAQACLGACEAAEESRNRALDERDAAREERRRTRRLLDVVNDELRAANVRAEQAERERDEWQAAHAAVVQRLADTERERDEAQRRREATARRLWGKVHRARNERDAFAAALNDAHTAHAATQEEFERAVADAEAAVHEADDHLDQLTSAERRLGEAERERDGYEQALDSANEFSNETAQMYDALKARLDALRAATEGTRVRAYISGPDDGYLTLTTDEAPGDSLLKMPSALGYRDRERITEAVRRINAAQAAVDAALGREA